jgi:GAF domain-containing protein
MHTAHERLTIRAEACEALFSSLSLGDILPAVGTACGTAHAGRCVGGLATRSGHHVVAAGVVTAISPESLRARVTGGSDGGGFLSAPLLVTDTGAEELLTNRLGSYAAAGIRSLAIMPLRTGGRTHGTVVTYYTELKAFSDTDRIIATALSTLGSSALHTAMLYESSTESKHGVKSARPGARARPRVPPRVPRGPPRGDPSRY